MAPAASMNSHAGLFWPVFVSIVLLATLMRLVFFTGFFGSDELTYTENALKLLRGDWSVSTYIGSIRYGINLPVAAMMALFGQNEFAASLWAFSCSVAEVAAVFYFGVRLLGFRAALFSALALCVLPLHVHLAGRLLADAPLALFITLTFLLFWHGERTRSGLSFLLAGIAAGMVFWIKESTSIFLSVFLFYPLLFWRWNWQWTWMLAGCALTIGANLLFFWWLSGDPFYVAHIIQSRMGSGYLDAGAIAFSPAYYPNYFFIKVWHTWLLPHLALLGLVLWMRHRRRLDPNTHAGLGYLSLWAAGMLTMFSLFVVSTDPWMWIPKQTNYMLMFMAPLALLAGFALQQLRGILRGAVVLAYFLPAIALAALEQNNILVFTANSKAAVDYAGAHPVSVVYGPVNAVRAADYRRQLQPHLTPIRILPLDEWLKDPGRQVPNQAYAIVDTQTLGWTDKDIGPGEVPECWPRVGTLTPGEVPLRRPLAALGHALAHWLPAHMHARLMSAVDRLTIPAPAYLYRITDKSCAGPTAHR